MNKSLRTTVSTGETTSNTQRLSDTSSQHCNDSWGQGAEGNCTAKASLPVDGFCTKWIHPRTVERKRHGVTDRANDMTCIETDIQRTNQSQFNMLYWMKYTVSGRSRTHD